MYNIKQIFKLLLLMTEVFIVSVRLILFDNLDITNLYADFRKREDDLMEERKHLNNYLNKILREK